MELRVHVIPQNLLPANESVLTIQASLGHTVKQFKDWLSKNFNLPNFKNCYLVWAGSVLSDSCILSNTGLKSSCTVCLIPPSTFARGASIDSLNIFQDLQYHYAPNSNQRNDESLIDLVKSFTSDLSKSEAPWKPTEQEVRLLLWVIQVLENNRSPTVKNPAVIWCGEYGCALIARQNRSEMVMLTLVCLDTWTFHIHSHSSSREHSSFPKDPEATVLFVGSVSLECYGDFLRKVRDKLDKVQERRNNERTSATGKQGHHKTPGMVQAIMLEVLKTSNEDDPVIPKGGFTDVGLHTGGQYRNTAWHVILGVIYHLLDSKKAGQLFRQVLLQLPLRMAEHCVKYLLSEIRSPSSAFGESSKTCRQLTDSIMQTLCHAAQAAEEFAKMDICREDFVIFEARCIRVRYELDCAAEMRASHVARQYILPSLSPSNVLSRDICLSITAKREAREHNDTEDIWKIVCDNLSLLPAPPSDEASWEDMENWMNENCSSYKENYVKQQVICRAVESFFFQKIMDTSSVSSARVQEIMDEYRRVARELQKCDKSRALLRAELMSKELLVVWITFCIVHRSAKNSHPLLSNYSVALRADDMSCLVLSEKCAVNAALQVARYLSENQGQRGPIFSCLSSDETMDFAVKRGKQMPIIESIWKKENRKMSERQASRWEQINCQQQKLETLDQELEDLERELTEVTEKRQRLHDDWHREWLDSGCSLRKPFILRDTIREEGIQNGKISSKKAQIRSAQKAPPPILQPLPANESLAMTVLFFFNMPSDLQVLSRLSFTAQQMLLPCQQEIIINESPGAVTRFNVDHEISTRQPGTLWYDYYVSESTARVCSATRTDVILGSLAKTQSGTSWYSSNVRSISTSSNGVWYPDSLKPKLFWKGGSFELDSRLNDRYLDPFKSLSPLFAMHKFTEQLPAAIGDPVKDSMQWALLQRGESTSHTRGNFALSSQDRFVNWLPTKNEFLEFCSMRAYPLQQVRRLCAMLSNRSLPLMNKQVQVLMQQTIHQLGQITMDGRTEREWHTDLNMFDGWASLRTILDDLSEELQSKSREHGFILILGQLAAQASEWDDGCRAVARKFAAIAEKAADKLAEAELNANVKDAPSFRARRCILYITCLICHSAGELSGDDVAQMCKAIVMADYTRLFEDPTSYDADIRNLTSLAMSVIASRIPEVLKKVDESQQILTDAVRNVHEAAPLEMIWTMIRDRNGSSTTSCHAVGTDGHAYCIDLHIGTVLVDGRPPSRLPESITTSPVYKRNFGDRNFEVVRKRDGSLTTTRRIGGYFYEFSRTGEGVVIKEHEGSYPTSSLELLDDTTMDSWGTDLPFRLKEMHSHWISRERNTILLRPKHFRDRRVQYVLTREGFDTNDSNSCFGGGRAVSSGPANWLCFKIPIHLQCKDWLARDRNFSKLNRLVHLTDDTSKQLVRVLRKFERTKGCIQTLQTPHNSFLITIPRYGLEFELTEDQGLKSNSFSSYKLSDTQNFDDTLMDFSQYLILESEGLQRVLVPSGCVCKNANEIFISGSEAIDEIRRFHVYSVHPRFETLDAVPGSVSIEARLQLGALYAATGTMLPEQRTGKTGGEHAIELMRQSWKNSPMSLSETRHLKSINSYGQLYPTLSLLAYELYSSAEQLSFLPFDVDPVSESVSLSIEASTEYVLRKKRLQLNPRLLLTEDEEDWLLGCGMVQSVRERQELVRDIETFDHASASEVMGDIRRILKLMICSHNKDLNSVREFPFQTDSLGNTSIGAKIESDLRESWNDYVKLPVKKLTDTDHERVKEQVQDCLDRCNASRNSMENAVLHALGRVYGSRMETSCFNIRRAANLEAQGTQRDLLKISSGLDNMEQLNPFLTTASREKIHAMILEWMQSCVMEDKLRRMSREIERNSTFEFVRELKEVDRRWDITQHPSWLAFEVEGQLQIRDLQYRVTDFCLRNPGSITQLNMGEGKTRVILPMLLLELTKSEHLMRIHFLSPLLSEAYDFLHNTITASVLNRRLLRIPFHRDVKLSCSQAVKLLECLRRCQNNGGAICIAPEHRLSLLLKKSELELQDSPSSLGTRKVLQQIYDLHYFDFFDESDELLHHRYQLIYAVGSCIPLCSGKERWIASQAVLQQLQRNYEVAKVLEDVAKRDKFDGRFPGSLDHIRLFPDCTDEQQQDLARKLARAISRDPPYHMRWLKGNPDIDVMVSFLTEEDKHLEWLYERVGHHRVSGERKECLLALRGILAYGLLRHCLSHRYRVDYGIDPRRENRRVAVPYRGSDMPSDRAEYAHPDILILFTHLAYYYRGLSKEEVTEAVQALLKLGPVAQREEYRLWFQSAMLSKEEKLSLIDCVDKLDSSNEGQMTFIHEIYQYNMEMISFWLDSCVLPRETMQFPQRLTANAFHLTDNKNGNIIGFSGTKDNSILLPVQVTQELPNISQVKATDGKMLDLMLKNKVAHCLPSSVSLFEALLNMCVEKNVSALIDAGALMAGLENEEVAQRMVDALESVGGHERQGVVYFAKKEASWMVLSLDGRQWPLGSSPIHERDSFVYFDESHCRGADMKLRDTASALLTVGPDMCKDKIMQAAGRMRKLDRGQTLMFAVPAEIAGKIPVTCGSTLSSKELLQWVVENTSRATAKGLISWGAQGSLYNTTQDVETRLTNEALELDDLYRCKVQVKPISHIVAQVQSGRKHRVLSAGRTISDAAKKMMEVIMDRARQYGGDQSLILSQADEECEREIEHERELEQEKEMIIPKKTPCPQKTVDFDKLLRTTDFKTILQLTNAVSISSAMNGPFKNLKVDGIMWENCDVYLTQNFLMTVQEGDESLVKNLSNYLRPVDTVIFFHSGRCCLLISEWEADKLLRSIWKYFEDSGGRKEMAIWYTNFAFLFPSKAEQTEGRCHFCIPSNRNVKDVISKASELTLAGLQLFGGQTMFHSEGRKKALKEMLATAQAKRSALLMVSLRGSQRMIPRSDLEDICSMKE